MLVFCGLYASGNSFSGKNIAGNQGKTLEEIENYWLTNK